MSVELKRSDAVALGACFVTRVPESVLSCVLAFLSIDDSDQCRRCCRLFDRASKSPRSLPPVLTIGNAAAADAVLRTLRRHNGVLRCVTELNVPGPAPWDSGGDMDPLQLCLRELIRTTKALPALRALRTTWIHEFAAPKEPLTSLETLDIARAEAAPEIASLDDPTPFDAAAVADALILGRFPRLRELSLGWDFASDVVARSLGRHKEQLSLRLRLPAVAVRHVQASRIARAAPLLSPVLVAYEGGLGHGTTAARALAGCARLRELVVTDFLSSDQWSLRSDYTDALEAFADCPTLRSLSLTHPLPGHFFWTTSVYMLTQLESLTLCCPRASDPDKLPFAALRQRLPRLRTLSLDLVGKWNPTAMDVKAAAALQQPVREAFEEAMRGCKEGRSLSLRFV